MVSSVRGRKPAPWAAARLAATATTSTAPTLRITRRWYNAGGRRSAYDHGRISRPVSPLLRCPPRVPRRPAEYDQTSEPAWSGQRVLAAIAFVVCLVGSALAQDAEREAAVRLARRGELRRGHRPAARAAPALSAGCARRRGPVRDPPLGGTARRVAGGVRDDRPRCRARLRPAGGRSRRARRRQAEHGRRLPSARRRAISRRPPGWRTTRVLVLVDLPRMDEARRLAEELYEEHPENLEVLLAKAYFHQQAAEPAEAFRLYSEVLRRAPDVRDAQRGRVLALQALGAPVRADELAQAAPGLLDPSERARVAGTRWAMFLRTNRAPSDDPRRGYAVTDRAIVGLQRQIAELQGRPGLEVALLRARFDLVVAYRDRERMADAVALYETLRREGVVPPAYVRNSAAAAYLYLERPETAHELYRSVACRKSERPRRFPRPLLCADRAGAISRGLCAHRRPRRSGASLPRVRRYRAKPTATPASSTLSWPPPWPATTAISSARPGSASRRSRRRPPAIPGHRPPRPRWRAPAAGPDGR